MPVPESHGSSPLIAWKCVLFPEAGVIYEGREPTAWHMQHYLKANDGPASRLHAMMRKHGTDWFTAEPAKTTSRTHAARQGVSLPKTQPHREAIQRALREYYAIHPGVWQWANRKDRPHQDEWRVINKNGLHVVTNLRAWCRTHGYHYNAIKGRIRHKGFPYHDIEHIQKWNS